MEYHLYVMEKIQRGIKVADEQGAISQEDAEARLSKWTTQIT